jgi:hypothetical protein
MPLKGKIFVCKNVLQNIYVTIKDKLSVINNVMCSKRSQCERTICQLHCMLLVIEKAMLLEAENLGKKRLFVCFNTRAVSAKNQE